MMQGDQSTIKLDIVSAEASLFQDEVLRLTASGIMGDVGVEPGHAPLLSPLKPGGITYTCLDGTEDVVYVSGGVMEVLPHQVTILADHAVRAEDLDEAAAQEAQKLAQQKLSKAKAELDYSSALAELSAATAQLRLLKQIRSLRS